MKDTILTRCEQGELQGVSVEGIHTFFDIPYASDSGRFRPAGEPQRWNGQRDCTRPGPVFPQLPSRLDFVMGPTCRGLVQSEDAFRLNVFTPDPAGKLPVIFWIHGGGFVTGGAIRCYDGDAIARSGRAVVVTMNYRLGLLGNLYMDGVAPGNLSVLDLERALHWVRDNIEAFGGDPDSIVLAGQSAGAWYTQLLAGLPTTSAIAKAIVMLSYPGLPPQAPAMSQAMGARLCEGAGTSASGDALATLPVERILQEQANLLGAQARFGEVPIAFMPVAIGAVPADPGAAARARFAGKPVFIGWTGDETGSFFASNAAVLSATEERVLQKFKADFGEEAAVRYASVAQGSFDSKPYAALVEASSEKLFEAPARRFAEKMAEAASDVFAYQFDLQSPQPNVGAGHCFELPFFFGNFDKWEEAPMLEGIDVPRAKALSARAQHYLLNFVESGNPNGADLPRWNVFGGESGESMHFA